MQCEARLDECRDARAALGVADVPLDRTQQARLPAARLVDVAERVGLDHVAENRSGAVCFDEIDLSGLDLCEAERAAHQLHLGPAVRGGDPVAPAIVVRDRTLHDGVDRLARRQRRRPVGAAPPRPRPHPGRCRRRTARTVCSDHPARRARPGCRRSKVRVSEADSHRRR